MESLSGLPSERDGMTRMMEEEAGKMRGVKGDWFAIAGLEYGGRGHDLSSAGGL